MKSFLTRYKYAFLFLPAIPALYAYNPLPLWFLNDDFIHVPLSQHAVWGQRNSIRPVGDFSLYIDYLLWGNNAAGYHFTNLLLHLFNSVLVYHLCRRLFQKLNFHCDLHWWSACAALLFWGYAFHSEGVLWIIGRSSSLSSLFFLTCLILFLSGSRKWHVVLLSYTSFFLGLLTYESVTILPLSLIILAVAFNDFKTRANLYFIIGYWVSLAVYLVLRMQWTGEIAGRYEGEHFVHLNIPMLAGNFCKLTLRTFVAPQPDTKIFLFSAVALFALIVVLFVRLKLCLTKPLIGIIAVFLLSYLPYVSLGINTHGVEAERYLYLPSIFVCILAAAFFSAWNSRQVGLVVFGGLIVYHQCYLLKASNAFVVASDIAKKTIEIVKNNSEAKAFYFKNLPQTNYGIPVFRLGLEEGVNWQTGDSTASRKVNIISFNQQEHYYVTSKPNILHADTSAFVIPHVLKRNVGEARQSFDTIKNIGFNPQTDVLIDYQDEQIRVFQQQ